MTPIIYAGLQKDVRRDFFFSLPNPLDRVTKLVFEKMDADLSLAKTLDRRRATVKARQIAIYIARTRTPLTLQKIGDYFGGRNHSTIMNSIGVVEDLMFTDKEYKAKVIEILELL